MGELWSGVLSSSWGWNVGLMEHEGSAIKECGRARHWLGQSFVLNSEKQALFIRNRAGFYQNLSLHYTGKESYVASRSTQ